MSNLLLLGVGGPLGAAIPLPPSTLNPLDKAPGITLSNGNLTATNNNSAIANVRSTTPRTSGKLKFEITCGVTGAPSSPSFGLATASASLTVNIGTDLNSLDVDRAGGVFYNNLNIGASDPYVSGSIISLEVDFAGLTLFTQVFGGSRLGPFALPPLLSPAFVIVDAFNLNNSMTVNFGATAFAIAPTAGYSAWG